MIDATKAIRRWRAGWVLVAGCLLLSAVGCATTHASSRSENPPLDVPAPPPRAVESPDTDVPPPVPLPEEPARHPNASPRRTPPPANRPEPPKQEPPKTETAPPPQPTEPPKIEEPPKPSPTLQTIPAEAEPGVERMVRDQLSHASNDLSRVDYRKLNADARTQYDTAKGYVRQAEDALRAKNLVFARSLSEKAATIAAQLAGK